MADQMENCTNDSESLTITKIPKIELHAHLSGSLSNEIVEKLVLSRNNDDKCFKENITPLFDSLKVGNRRCLNECFDVFKLIHMLIDTLEVVKTVTYGVIKEFHEDNVCYLELRTTPKFVANAYTKEQFLKAVLDKMKEAEDSLGIVARLLISVDRARGIEDGWDTLNLARRFCGNEIYGSYVLGLDFSGNPNVSTLKNYIPIMKEARKSGLKLAVHLMEVDTKVAFEEAEMVIREGLVDRIGHGTFLNNQRSNSLVNMVLEKKIPLEMCITSNLKCGTIDRLEEHHVKFWYNNGHPVIISTDDKGVFSTTLSTEISLFSECTGATLKDIEKMILTSLAASFLGQSEKQKIQEKIVCSFKRYEFCNINTP